MRHALLFAAAWLCAIGARADPEFVIESELTPTTVYVGAEAVLRVRLLRAPGVPYGVLRPPAIDAVAQVLPLGRVRWSETRRGDAMWQVHERAYLILPRQAGRIEIPGAELEGPLRQLLAPGANPRGAINRLRGTRLQLEVREAPEDAALPWLPARALTLEETWSTEPADLRVGAPVTRTVTIRVEGLPAQRLPRLPNFEHPALRAHPDRAELATEHHDTGTIGRSLQRVVLVPLDEAEVVLPEFSVRWWDILADAPRVATLPARKLRLQQTAAPLAVEPAAPAASALAAWRWGAAALALSLGAALWWHARTHAERDARRRLRRACRANRAPAARDALLQWCSAREPGVPMPALQRIGDRWGDDARAALRALDAALYGRQAWDGRKFWRAVRPWLRRAPSQRSPATPAAAPFFRLQQPQADSPRRSS